MTTITIPTSAVAEIAIKIAKLNRKAVKHGFPVFDYDITNTRTHEIVDKRDGYDNVLVEVCDLTYDDEVTQGFDSYKFVGVTKVVDGINLLHTLDDSFDLKEHKGTCECDHCGHKRNRNKVFLLTDKEGEKGNVVRVGSTCINDFFPSGASNTISRFEFIDEIVEFINEWGDDGEWVERGGGIVPQVHKVKVLLSTAVLLSNTYGYVSTRQEREAAYEKPVTATRTTLVGHINDSKSTLLNDVTDEERTKARQKASDLMEWFLTLDSDESDYVETTQDIINQGYCSLKLAGYVVGIIGCWNANERKRIHRESITSGHVGTVGQRMEFTGTIKNIRTFESMYGLGCITTIETEDGNVLVYFNTLKVKGIDLEEGTKATFMAAVKKHDEYNGTPQTFLSRATKVKVVAE